jgi:NADH-quinone oxidoreductase subunit N
VNNLFLLFILLEAISLILYLLIIQHKKFFSLNFFKQNSLTKYQKFLIGFHLKSKYLSLNIFASITYFLLNILLSFFFLLGLMYIIMYFQTLSIYQLSALLEHIDIQNNKLISIAFFFILTLFLFKLGIVPFHWWVSAVFESSSIITLMFSSIPLKFSILLIFLKLFILIFSKILFNLQLILILCSLSSMLIGTLGLFQQSKLKKFWGYSTINHMGYLLLALNSFSFLGLRAFIIYSGFYILINFLFFFLIQILINETLNQRISYIHELKLLVPYKNNLLILLFTILILTSIGIPPLLGFRAKLLIISSLFFQLSQNWLIFSLCIIFITTILNAFCYLKIWKTLFLESPQIDKNHNMYRLLPIPLYHCCLLIFSCIIIFYYSYSLLFIMSKNNYKVIDDLVQIFFNYHEIY